MRKRQLSFICFLFSYLFVSANATDMYLLFDNSCMDKYDYIVTKKDAKGVQNISYTSYHIKINDNEKVILNTGPKGKLETYKPAGTKYCGDVVVSESFARQINSKRNTVHLVVKTKSGFRVLPVKSADYFFTTDAEMGYATKEYTFAYNYKAGSKKDLATKDSKGNVYFKSRDDEFCPSKYTFRRTPAKNHDPYSDFVLVPDVGLVSKKTGVDAAYANNNVLTLKEVNGIPLEQYMDAVCNGYVNYLTKEVAATKTTTSAGGKTTVSDLEGGNATTTTNTSTVVHQSNNDICDHLYKDLDKGFYYDRSTNQRAEGHCGGVNYHNGMMVTGTTSTHTQPAATPVTDTRVVYNQPETKVIYKEAPPRVIYKESPPKVIYKESQPQVVYKDRIVYRDRPQDEFASKGTATPRNSTSNVVTYHTVQLKETLYGISRKYGVTVAQIKQWNDMQSNVISPGQLVRIASSEAATETFTSKGNISAVSHTNGLRVGETVPGTQRVITETIGASTNSEYHIVKAKETLYSIAKRYGLTVDRLKAINNLKKNSLSIGQRLNLTATVPSSYNNVVIPKEYSASSPTTTTVATTTTAPPATVVLTEKGGELTPPPAVVISTQTTLNKNELISKGTTSTAPSTTDPLSVYDASKKVHIVGDSETLYTIAKWYGTTVDKLRALNNFGKNEVLLPNQKVRVR